MSVERRDVTAPAVRGGLFGRIVKGALALAVVGGVGYGLILWLTPTTGGRPAGPGGRAGAMGAPMPVAVATAVSGTMPVILNGLGTVTPLATVTVKTQISGQLVEVPFKEGQMVAKGDLLAQIDPRPYQVQLAQAQGTLERDQALLVNARKDLARYRKLYSQDSIAEQQVATQESLVQQDEGTVQIDQAAIDSAKLNLTYCHIVSPVDGRVGLRLVDQGNFVQTSDSGIAVVTQLKPITVLFTLPEDSIPQVYQRWRAGQKSGQSLPAIAYDRTQTKKLATGTLATIDNEVDTTTGTVKLKASFDNTDEALFPSQFVNVALTVDEIQNATLVPVSAVLRGAPGTFVYVVAVGEKPTEGTVSVRKVKLGVGDARQVVIAEGLKPGEIVVVDGSDRLREGARVAIPQAVAPDGAGPPASGERPHHRQGGDGQAGGGQTGGGDRPHRDHTAGAEAPAAPTPP